MKRLSLAASLIVIALTAGMAHAQQHPNLQRGFAADKVYQFGDIDSVNLFNGNLQLSIPIGGSLPNDGGMTYGLSLVYNSKLWDHEEAYCNPLAESCKMDYYGDEYGHPYVRAIPNRRANAGIGWMVSLGRLIAADDPIMDGLTSENNPAAWIYESPDGADHMFLVGASGYFYTKNSSFLRLHVVSDLHAEVHHQDGHVHTFTRGTAGTSMRLTKMRDAFGNEVTITYGPLNWTITDKFQRVTTVQFQRLNYLETGWADVVSSISVPRFSPPGGGQPAPAVYNFNYSSNAVLIARGCTEFTPQEQRNVQVALLNSIGLPDGSSWSFQYNQGSNCDSGIVVSASVPTGGTVAWTFGNYLLPSGSCDFEDQFLSAGPGVVTRAFTGLHGEPAATWTYQPDLDLMSTCPTSCAAPAPPGTHKFSNTVTTPLGDRTRHHFSAWPDTNVASCNGSLSHEYGKPFTRQASVSRMLAAGPETLFLSTESFDCPPTGQCTSPQLLRSSYVRYDSDAPELEANWRLAGERTVFHDDAGKYVDTLHHDYAGYGRYRQTILADQSSAVLRSTTTNYNVGTIVPPAKWILGRYDSVTRTEGSSTEKTLFCFDSNNGFLSGRRVLHNGSSPTGTDILTRFDHTNGNVIREEWSGGDTGPIPTAGGCLATVVSPTYRIDHTYQFGSLATSQHYGSGFLGLDLTIDPNTGLASSSRDTALVPTSYLYDAMGRLTSVTPQGAARTTYEYLNANGASAPATVVIKQFDSSNTMLTQADVQYDSFGRVWKERQLMPDGSLPVRETRRNAMGWLDRVSERGSSHWTIYGGYDPFGRVGTITAPDSSVTSFTYQGMRETKKTSSISGSNAVVTHLNDSLGRLKYVIENEPNTITTTYGYDVGDRLVSVGMVGPDGSQSRLFTYDLRGFLTSETHPETGQIQHGSYDARGHAGSRTFPNAPWPNVTVPPPGYNYATFDLQYAYDSAERLTNVRSRNPNAPTSFRDLKQFVFGAGAGPGDRSRGKLTHAIRHNYGPTFGTAIVTEQYLYQDDAGRATVKLTEVKKDNSVVQKFQQSFAYDPLGGATSLTYPTCILPGVECGQSSVASVSNTYQRGLLKSISATGNAGFSIVPTLASDIGYHPSGMLKSIDHGNGVRTDQFADPHGMPRPSQITFSGGLACAPPTITQQPQSKSVPAGTTTRLTVTASGNGTLSYQWYQGPLGDRTIPLGTNVPYLDVTPTQPTSYWVRITNACGSTSGNSVAKSSMGDELVSPSSTTTTGSVFSNLATITQSLANGATFISQSVPATMTPGQTYAVSVTMRNSGSSTWTAAEDYKLGSANPLDNMTWGLKRVLIPDGTTVPPNTDRTFTFNVTAPTTPGTYNFQWRMVREFIEWFGASSTNVPVNVVSSNCTASVAADRWKGDYFNNTGLTGSPVLVRDDGAGDLNFDWGVGSPSSACGIPADNFSARWTRTISFAAGTYRFTTTTDDGVRLYVDGVLRIDKWIPQAPTSYTADISLTAGNHTVVMEYFEAAGGAVAKLSWQAVIPDNSTFVSQSVPTSMVAGQTYSVSVTLKNSGTNTWVTNEYRLGSMNPQDNTRWGLNRVNVPAGTSVLPGANHTFTFNVTAPSTAGNYNFQWLMIHEWVAWFGAYTPNVVVAVSAPAAPVDGSTFVSQSVPSAMIPGQTYPVSITLNNSGTSTWVTNDFRLGSMNPQDNTRWGLNRVNVPAGVSVPPGSNHTFNFNVTAPSTVGDYNFQWLMIHEWVAWFGAYTPNLVINVAPNIDRSTFVSQSVPMTMTRGQTYQVSITLTNSGTSTWVTNEFRLGSMNPQDNTRWGLNRVNVPSGVSVAPGANHTFTFNVTAPATAGSYNFQWLMIHEWVAWFGDYTPNLAIQVQ